MSKTKYRQTTGSKNEVTGNDSLQNALDVLSAAQQDNEAKQTSGPGAENASSGGGNSDGSAGTGSAGGISGGGSDGSPGGASSTGQSSGGDQGRTSSNEGTNGDSTNKNGQSSGNSGSGGGSSNSGPSTNGRPAEQVVDINGSKHTVAAPGGVAVIDGATLPADGTPTTINGQTVSAVNGGIVIGTQTISLGSNQSPGTGSSQQAVAVIDGQRFTAVPGNSDGAVVFDGTTLTVGGVAITAQGVTLSAASNGVVIDGSTLELSYSEVRDSQRPAVLTLGSSVATASQVSSGIFAIGTVTLTAGGSDATISGHTVSAASTGIVVDGSSAAPDASGTQDAEDTQNTASSDELDGPAAAGSGAAKGNIHWTSLIGFAILLGL